MRSLLILLGFFSGCYLSANAQDLASLSQQEKKAQEKEAYIARNDFFRMTSIAIAQTQTQDLRMSPLIYSGVGAYLDLCSFRRGDKSFRALMLTLSYAGAVHQIGSWNLMHLPSISLDYALEKMIGLPWGSLYLGGTLHDQLNCRIYAPLGNNAFAMDNQLALSPSMTFVKEHLRGSRWSLQMRTRLALAGFTLRYPAFTYEGLETQFLFVGAYRNWKFELAGIRAFKHDPNNRFFVAYQFELYRFSSGVDEHPVSQYVNSIKVAFWLHRK